ncbi:MAG: CDP-glycerol glycerophosphotransferase family protein [Breznakia sp.]
MLKEKLRKNQIINECLYRSMYVPKKIVSFFLLIKLRKKKKTKTKIRVGIMVQLPSLWGKTARLYEELSQDAAFEVVLLAIPDYKFESQLPVYKSMENHAYTFLKENHFDAVKTNTETGWVDIATLKLDYLFYPRPYDALMPKGYKSCDVIKYIKTCYIPYGYLLGKTLMRNAFHLRFFTNLYFYFAENKDFENYNKNRFRFSHFFQLRKSVYTGYPSLQNVLEQKVKKCLYWKEHDKTLKIMWTPRWTIDEKQGKSNFFKYKDAVLHHVQRDDNLSLVVRPHPLAFANFIDSGLMSEVEVEEYKQQFEHERLFLDQQSDYQATMWCADVLITDFSSIIIEYFMMDKPLIYCRSHIEATATLQKILDVSYIADDFDDIKRYVEQLAQGMDPLKKKRHRVLKEVCDTQKQLHTSQNIVELLKKDAK